MKRMPAEVRYVDLGSPDLIAGKADGDVYKRQVETDTRYEKLSTDRSDCRLSFASPVGLRCV